jgi:hypothetical protein
LSDLVFGDVFGIVRVALGKKLALKTTAKAAAPRGGVSVDGSGKLALGNGRVQTGVHGHNQAFLLNLPGLGLRLKRAAFDGPVAFAGELVAHLGSGRISLYSVQPDELSLERELPLADPLRSLPRHQVGPGEGSSGQRLLHVHPDGRFAAFVEGRLWAGHLGEGRVVWSLEVALQPTVALDLVRLDEKVCLVVMDHAGGKARLLSIDDRAEPEIELLELEAIGLPAVTDTQAAYQPSSELVVRRTAGGAEERFDVSAFNTHPYPEPEPGFYLTTTAPPPPDRLPGRLYARGEHLLFVPWHAETVVELATGRVLDRGLLPGAGPLRRGVLQVIARNNAALAQLQLEAALSHLEPAPKQQQCPMGIRLPEGPPTLTYLVATGFACRLTPRFELRTHGWGWGSLSQEGGTWRVSSPADLDETLRLLRWMLRADYLPLEADREVGRLYAETLGIPNAPRPESAPLQRDAERLWLRATLETVASCRWPVSDVPERWASEPITPQMAIAALRGLSSWSRSRPYDGLHLVSCALVHHLDRDAQPVLLSLITDFPEPFNWKQYRDAGELLVWLCHRHPDLAASSLAAVRGVSHPHPQAAAELKVVAEALERGARHLWSNG